MVIIKLLVKTEQNVLFLFLFLFLFLHFCLFSLKQSLSSLTLAPGRKSHVFVQDQLKRLQAQAKTEGAWPGLWEQVLLLLLAW
jgi:hypothetical protein